MALADRHQTYASNEENVLETMKKFSYRTIPGLTCPISPLAIEAPVEQGCCLAISS